ncbi:PilW family protein [Halopseudomonas sp.]|uniref:PilW family protein n=1 Tax=Halopseudomonas sp. TaxID=2901191 RepID=UPI0030020703
MMPRKQDRRQSGLSIIEILVALALSSLLILGITQIYIDNKSNYAFQQGQSDNIEGARYSMLIFEEELYRAGYRTRPDANYEDVFRASVVGDCSFATGEVVSFDNDAQRLCVRYQPNVPGVTACDGSALTAAADPYVESVEPAVVSFVINDGNLLCNGEVIVANVVDFRLEFGVSPEGVRETEKYTLAPAANERIRSVRYGALIKSRATNLANEANSPQFAAWREKWYDEEDATPDDLALYMVTENTLALRNLTQ